MHGETLKLIGKPVYYNIYCVITVHRQSQKE